MGDFWRYKLRAFMKLGVRICLYLVLAMIAAFFFGRFKRAYHEGVDRGRELVQLPAVVLDPAAVELAATNRATEASENTNAPTTNAAPAAASAPAARPIRPAASYKADALLHLGSFVITLLALGGLVAWEVSRHFGSRAGKSVMAEDWVERRDPEYEKAEEEWAKGHHIEAINLMREYLKKNPDEQHVALRIAEIYEKDLNNPVAAVLEIEEVLKHKLGREKWGWTAIRLSNLYSGRLNQPDKALAILDRIVNEYGDTAAAKKARQRLGIPESEEAPAEVEAADSAETAEPEAETPPPSPTPPPPEPPSHLPKGFRPKK